MSGYRSGLRITVDHNGKEDRDGGQVLSNRVTYDLDGFLRSMKRAQGLKVLVPAGMIPAKSVDMALYGNKSVSGGIRARKIYRKDVQGLDGDRNDCRAC